MATSRTPASDLGVVTLKPPPSMPQSALAGRLGL